MASELIEELYEDGYISEETVEYRRTYENLDYIIQKLPIFDASEFRDDFFGLIGSVEVVPIRFRRDFISAIEQLRYFDAVGYILPISKGQFGYLNRKARIASERGQLFLNSEYDDSLGLILDSKSYL